MELSCKTNAGYLFLFLGELLKSSRVILSSSVNIPRRLIYIYPAAYVSNCLLLVIQWNISFVIINQMIQMILKNPTF